MQTGSRPYTAKTGSSKTFLQESLRYIEHLLSSVVVKQKVVGGKSQGSHHALPPEVVSTLANFGGKYGREIALYKLIWSKALFVDTFGPNFDLAWASKTFCRRLVFPTCMVHFPCYGVQAQTIQLPTTEFSSAIPTLLKQGHVAEIPSPDQPS